MTSKLSRKVLLHHTADSWLSPLPQAQNELEALKATGTVVVADTGDFESGFHCPSIHPCSVVTYFARLIGVPARFVVGGRWRGMLRWFFSVSIP